MKQIWKLRYNLETKCRYFDYPVFSEIGFILDREVLLSFNTTSKVGDRS